MAIISGGKKETHTYTEFLHAIVHLCEIVELDTPENWYLMVFGKELPKKTENIGGKIAANNESPLGNPDSDSKAKTGKNEQKTDEKREKKCGSSTGGVQHETDPEENTQVEAVKNGENNESPLGDQLLKGQTEIGDFVEKMPINYENSSEDDTQEQELPTKSSTEAAVESEENNESSLVKTVSEVVPDLVEGVCQYCAGNKQIESNDGQFTIKLTPRGIGRIEKKAGISSYAVLEFDFCPKCGKKLG